LLDKTTAATSRRQLECKYHKQECATTMKLVTNDLPQGEVYMA
jgi:hypothetical protein